jgi:hypothetical protein
MADFRGTLQALQENLRQNPGFLEALQAWWRQPPLNHQPTSNYSPAEALGQQLDLAKADIPRRPRVGPGRYLRGGLYGGAQVARTDLLQQQYEDALGNPQAAQNSPGLIPELWSGLGPR